VAQFPERTHLVGAYALGKTQRVIRLIREAGYDKPLYIHGALASMNTLYQRFGIDLGLLEPATVENTKKADFAGAIVIAPPSALATAPWRKVPPRARTAAANAAAVPAMSRRARINPSSA